MTNQFNDKETAIKHANYYHEKEHRIHSVLKFPNMDCYSVVPEFIDKFAPIKVFNACIYVTI